MIEIPGINLRSNVQNIGPHRVVPTAGSKSNVENELRRQFGSLWNSVASSVISKMGHGFQKCPYLIVPKVDSLHQELCCSKTVRSLVTRSPFFWGVSFNSPRGGVIDFETARRSSAVPDRIRGSCGRAFRG